MTKNWKTKLFFFRKLFFPCLTFEVILPNLATSLSCDGKRTTLNLFKHVPVPSSCSLCAAGEPVEQLLGGWLLFKASFVCS